MPNAAKLALLLFWGAFLSIVISGCFASNSAPNITFGLKLAIWSSTIVLLVGAVLCWRSGWSRYKEEHTHSVAKRLIQFAVLVWFAPFTLPFSRIDFPWE
jgi:ABC-type nickel/cobalt efflux system permease component RcnA